MRKNLALVALISFMFVFSLQIAQPVSAAKLKVVDKGSFTEDYGYGKCTNTWKTYQKGTYYVKIVATSKSPGHTDRMTMYLIKVSKRVLKIKTINNGKWTGTMYLPSKLTAAQYYWKYIRPGITYRP